MTRFFSLAALGSAILFTAVSTQAQAAEKSTGSTAVFATSRASQKAPDLITGTGFYVTSTSVSYQADGFPCYGCSSGGTIAIPYPLAILGNGTAVVVTAQFQSSAYTGIPIVYLKVVQNNGTIYSAAAEFSSSFFPGYVGYAYFPMTLPSSSGGATAFVEVVDAGTGNTISSGGTKFGIY